MSRPRTLGALKAAGYRPRSLKDEIRENLIARLRSGEKLFPSIIGYEHTVEPQIVNALLSRHDFILLGLRGQAKTRLLRSLARFLDEWIPAIEGCPLNSDPCHPLTHHARALLERGRRAESRAAKVFAIELFDGLQQQAEVGHVGADPGRSVEDLDYGVAE